MKKTYIFIIITLILLGIGFGFYYFNSKDNKISNNSEMNDFSYNSTRVSTNNETAENASNSSSNEQNNENNQTTSSNENANNEQTTDTQEQNADEAKNETENSNSSQEQNNQQPKETQIAEYTTKIYTKDSNRQNNLSIACSTLNGTTVENKATFSFCNTLGKATTAKGYKKADVFQDDEVIQALGGGNCQVSSTLYNAVLKVPGLDITERHEHSNSVPYVSKGKDAAIAYGSYDFKFVNNTRK